MKLFVCFWFLVAVPVVLVLNAVGGVTWFEHNFFSGVVLPLALLGSETSYGALILTDRTNTP